ncbi:MAG TPA: hypothetical protein VKQ32_24855 [Polyangia bacterium]|nr:hypothetical protein [Polyangia bacterium]
MTMTHPGLRMIGCGLAAAALAAGCTATSSKDLRTGQISAGIRVTATSASAATVHVAMSPGNGVDPLNPVKLEGGDALYAEASGLRWKLGAVGSDYEASLPTGAAETQVQVILDRPNPNEADAPDSIGALPPPFELSPLSIVDMPRSQPESVSWSPSGTADRMLLAFQGSCVEDVSFAIDGDPGTYGFALEGEFSPSSCTVTMTLTRSRAGVVDPNLNPGSSFVLEQVRTAAFHSSP